MKRIITAILTVFFVVSAAAEGVRVTPSYAAEAISIENIRQVAEDLINWKKSDVGSESDGYLINDKFLEQAGTTPGDWFPIGLGRLGIEDNQSAYLAVINDNVQKRYDDGDGKKLSEAKATEWHRIALAVLACGGNPRAVGEDRNGDGRGDIDLIADGTYNRVDEYGAGIVGKQGINGFIWALIAVDSMYYEIPDDAYYTRDDLISNLLKRQLADGGWALTGEVSDPDITAMALQALAPYYCSEKEYVYQNAAQSPTGGIVTKKVRTAADEAVAWLSENQLADGDYYSWGTPNCESTVQVAVALTSLGIDVFSDKRFIKTGADGNPNTLYDGILKYRTESGGFTHSFVSDDENPSAVAGEPNTMASEQVLYGLAALIRFSEGARRLYDFRAEQSDALKTQIAEVETQIDALDAALSSKSEIQRVYDLYLAIDGAERSYVSNYKTLSNLLSLVGIEYEKEEIEYNGGDAGIVVPTEYFNYSDQAAVNALSEIITTAYRSEVLRLWNKIKNSVDFEGKRQMTVKLEKIKNQIDDILAEIDDIKAQIKEYLYPFDRIGLDKRGIAAELYGRYMSLSEYDRSLFETSDVEGLLKCKTQTDNLLTALIIGITCAAAAAGVSVWVVLHIRKRRKSKLENSMRESDE